MMRRPAEAFALRCVVVSIGVSSLIAANNSVEQTSQGTKPALPLLVSFNGLGADLQPGPGSNHPPAPRNASDNSLAVGPEHVFQIVNSQLAIFTKTGTLVYGPTSTNTLFAGMGSVCEDRPNGDAVVRYDQLARRWLVVMPIFRRTVFDADRSKPGQPARPGEAARASVGRPGPPPPLPPTPQRGQRPAQPSEGTYAICYAVSTGTDPLGNYNRYVLERPLF